MNAIANKETIKLACVKYDDKLYTGFNHGECFKKLPQNANMSNTIQGFITNNGRFVDRRNAYKIAENANQIKYKKTNNDILISEDLYEYWLNEQKMELEKSIILKPDRFVIISNGWKNKKWGIAKIYQQVNDIYSREYGDYMGDYHPCFEYGEFSSLEDAVSKLKEIKNE